MANRTSRIILAKGIKIDREYKNILDYSESDMLTLLRSQTHFVNELTNCSFIRKTSTICVDISYEQAIQSNYIAFQNPDYSNKWFFAWIDEIKYIGENNIEISYTIDVWSTWSGNLTKKACWVEREHVTDDTIGKHTIEEGLACNNFKALNVTIDPLYLQDPYIVVMTTYDIDTETNMGGASIWNGAVTGAKANIFRYEIAQRDYAVYDLEKYILFLNQKDKLDAVQSIYIVPASVLGLEPSEGGQLLDTHTVTKTQGAETITIHYYTLDGMSFNPATFTTHVRNLYSDLSYTPHNNKCLCYPYHYLFITNNSGNANIYKGEFFSDRTDIQFSNQMVMSPGVSGRIAPLNYKGSSYNYDEGVVLGKYPTCGWANDQYVNWLTQNAVNEPVKIFNNVLGAVSGVASGVKTYQEGGTKLDMLQPIGTVVNNIASIIGDFYSAKLLPSTSAGSNVGDVSFCTYSLRFDYYNMILNDEELKIIDNYFTRFGYKVNTLKIPEFSSRTYWNFIKIAEGENIGYGVIPSKSMDTINRIFRAGVSVWHNHANVGDFSLANW